MTAIARTRAERAPGQAFGIGKHAYTELCTLAATVLLVCAVLAPQAALSDEAVDDTYEVAQDSNNNKLEVLANDDFGDDDNATIWSVGTPDQGGNATISGNRREIRYTPAEGFVGTESFDYIVRVAFFAFYSATVTVEVVRDNSAPVADEDAYTTDEDTSLNIGAGEGVLDNDSDPDGDTLTAQLVDNAANGTVTLEPDGSFSYAPDANFNGEDSFTYRADDGKTTSGETNVSITVNAVDDPPVITSMPDTTASEDSRYQYRIVATDDETQPTVEVPTRPDWLGFDGDVTLSGTPTADDIGSYEVTVEASDGVNDPVEQRFELVVEAIDDAPVVDAIPEQSATANREFELDLREFVFDEDTPEEELEFQAQGVLPSGLSLSATGLLAGVPAMSAVGTQQIRFSVGDGNSRADGQFVLVVREHQLADLSLTMSAAPNPALVGATAEWTLTVANGSDTQVDAPRLEGRFTGPVPFSFDGADNAGCTLSPDGNATQLSCMLGVLPAGESQTVTLTGSGNQPGDILGTASVQAEQAEDETPEDNETMASLSIAEETRSESAQRLAGFSALSLAGGDLDGDGHTDLAVATDEADSVLVFLNVTDPENERKRVLNASPLSLGAAIRDNDIAIGDLDGDSDLDIVASGAADQPARIFINDGAAAFEATELTGSAADDSRAVAIGDFDGDGYTDLAFANASPNTIYLSQGVAGAYDPALRFGNATSVDVAVANLFGDALPEIIFADASGDAKIYEFAGDAPAVVVSPSTGPTTSIAAENLTGDSGIDVLFGRAAISDAHPLPSNPLYSNTSSSSPSFFASEELGAAPTFAVLVDDTDFDGYPDAIVLNETQAHQVFANTGGSSNAFVLEPVQLITTSGRAATLGSFGTDARRDLAIGETDGVAIFYNDGRGVFGLGDTERPEITLVGEKTVTLEVGATYEDAGATASDAVDGDLTDEIVVDNPVDPDVVGTYVVSYDVTDNSANAAETVTRTVEIEAREATGGGGGGGIGLTGLACLFALLSLRRRYAIVAACRILSPSGA